MRAVVLDGPGPPEALAVRWVPVPVARRGWVLVRVEAFGLNRSEVYTRLGLSEGVVFPRVPGIEAVGVVAACPGLEFDIGHQVAALMGGMGREFDGGYAEYTSVPVSQVIPFDSTLDWATLGAVPEMLQTAYGCLTLGLDAQPGQSLLVRGGTSSVGLMTATLAKRRGMTVFSTTRRLDRLPHLAKAGVDHPLVDDGDIASQVRAILPGGVDTALELVGTTTLPDTLRATRIHGVVCYAGALSSEWLVKDFKPNAYIPHGVRLTGYGGDAQNLPPDVFQAFLDDIWEGRVSLRIGGVFSLDQIAEAHRAMDADAALGKLVVTVGRTSSFDLEI